MNLHQKHFTFVKFEIISTQTERQLVDVEFDITSTYINNDTKILPALSLDTQ